MAAQNDNTEHGVTTERLVADPSGLARAAALLRDGGCVAFPTETVYGLGADATKGEAVARIYAAKGRPSFNPLISHVPDLDAVREIAQVSDLAARLAEAFWPGPMTLVLPKADGCPVSQLATAGLETIAVRVPASKVAQQVLQRAGVPIAAPSANRSGRLSPTRAAHVIAQLDGRIDAVVDGGACDVGIESTILGVLDARVTLLRPGRITPRDIKEACDIDVSSRNRDDKITAPGQLVSHYAPQARLRLNVDAPAYGDVHIGFGVGQADLNLSPTGDLVVACAALFEVLHRADALAAERGGDISVAPLPSGDLGDSLMDRLRRASSGG